MEIHDLKTALLWLAVLALAAAPSFTIAFLPLILPH